MTTIKFGEVAVTKTPETIDAYEVARMLDVSRYTALELFKRGELKGYKRTRGITSQVRFYRADVIRYAREVQHRDIK